MENAVASSLKQFVVFRLDLEEYGVDIQKVTTIEKMIKITRVPKTPEVVRGVINLRGEIIPIIDLRRRFNLEESVETEDTRIIIFRLDEISTGIIVDSVAEVLDLEEDQIESVNSFSADLSLDFILGVGKMSDRIVTLLNLEKLIKI